MARASHPMRTGPRVDGSTGHPSPHLRTVAPHGTCGPVIMDCSLPSPGDWHLGCTHSCSDLVFLFSRAFPALSFQLGHELLKEGDQVALSLHPNLPFSQSPWRRLGSFIVLSLITDASFFSWATLDQSGLCLSVSCSVAVIKHVGSRETLSKFTH